VRFLLVSELGVILLNTPLFCLRACFVLFEVHQPEMHCKFLENKIKNMLRNMLVGNMTHSSGKIAFSNINFNV
jgi:hypothetical protein